MSYRKFALYNVIGGAGWVLSMTLAGYFLGQIPWIQRNFEIVVLAIVFISVLPLAIHALKHYLGTPHEPDVATAPALEPIPVIVETALDAPVAETVAPGP
jgi:membrane-associated protein